MLNFNGVELKDVSSLDFGGMMGMCEMEEACRIVLYRAIEAGGWAKVSFCRMETEGQQTGLLELVLRGWMSKSHPLTPGNCDCWCYNGEVYPSPQLIERIMAHVRKTKDKLAERH